MPRSYFTQRAVPVHRNSTADPSLDGFIPEGNKQHAANGFIGFWSPTVSRNYKPETATCGTAEKIFSSHSANIPYNGKPLKPGSSAFYWKVKVWDNHGRNLPIPTFHS